MEDSLGYSGRDENHETISKMNAKWRSLVGDADTFVSDIQKYALAFQRRLGRESCDLNTIRAFVSARNNQITDDAIIFKEIVGAFACVLKDYYAQEIRVRGFLKKRIEVVGKGYRGELLIFSTVVSLRG